ncbi:ABC transporter ATP-binding protein [Dellaglioa algida]|uniref:Multidrug ABC transporter ATP-binding protein n=1 Tax=Dellaglioa algida TaxID=105612 RepID=A0A5C6MD70_9LACO|nr:ABC transporter ATP-binding protein [Dellaglioa algida]MDK1716040.1 ABC transporter ATP-binding protein/permease [Dellaglioa algida]MDK1719321.1 ABC transporter ATP-binding protein/permease [Dellaglioa algida]MDK1721177.1 ABC transporter ATP-binding protein/permease [Dellaglioa algida]MDK1722664.1 ABC transporter ATP-binding protein/permease [Dellaglioa algida]MDK1724283.1 ABC transporter ATP-binding protein/permease [Dellaglioa algida]
MADNNGAGRSATPPMRGGRGGGPGGNIGRPVEKPKNFWKTIGRLAKYMSPWLLLIGIVLVLAIISVIFQAVSPKILGQATTEIFSGVTKGFTQIKQGQKVTSLPIDFNAIKNILFTVGAMYVASALFSFIQQLIMTNISQKTVYALRKDIKAKMERVPISYYDTHPNGDIMSRAVNDVDNISGTLQQSFTQLVTSIVTFVSVLYMMFSISWELTLIALIIVPLSLGVVSLIAPRSQKFFAGQQKSLGLLNNQVEETYAGHTVVKTFNKEEKNIEIFEKQNSDYYKDSWKAQFISGLIMPAMNFSKNIGYVFVAVVGGIKVSQGTITLGNVQAFLQYVNQFSQPITQIANLSNTIQATVASAERIFEVLDEEELKDESNDNAAVPDNGNKISFEHVQFGYADKKLLMTDYNLDVKEGQKVAIVGPTGAGKTTIINLIERFYDVSSGSIRLNGVDTKNLKREELRKSISMVLQDTWLFTGTIMENIQYGRKDATDEEVYAAAKAAHVDTFVRQLPDGYQTVLNEDASNISQGQRQLLTIARAFLADPEILILDEATSSVDTRTEVLIQKAMDTLLDNRTSFVVAHRLSTIRDADNIIVMDNGSIIETGNHDVLIAKNGFYADLYNSQFTNGTI